MSTEEINSVSVRDTLSEDTLRIIQNLSNKTQKLSALWKQVYHMTGRTHFLATDIIAEWEEGAKTEYFSGETIDFSKLHVYLHKDDEYTLEDENQIEETSSYVPSITVVPEVSENKVVKITISYGSGSEAISTTINITAKKVAPMPIDLDYYEGYGYSNYDGELLPEDNSTCCFTNVEFTTGVKGNMTFYPNDCAELSNVNSDCQVSVPVEIEYNSKTKLYNLPVNVHYHPIVDEQHVSGYASDYNFIYVLSGSSETTNISIDRSSSTYQYGVGYDDGKYTATSSGGSLTYSENDMSIGLHTRNATISFDDGTILEKEITIKVVNPTYKISHPITTWLWNAKITCDDVPVYLVNNLHFNSMLIKYDRNYYSIDDPDNRTLLNEKEILLEFGIVKDHMISYIESEDGVTDVYGNAISRPQYKYYQDQYYDYKYIAVDSDGDIIIFNENKNGIGFYKDSTYIRHISVSFDGEVNVGDEVKSSGTYTVTRVLSNGDKFHAYMYVIEEEYLAWAEEYRFTIVDF